MGWYPDLINGHGNRRHFHARNGDVDGFIGHPLRRGLGRLVRGRCDVVWLRGGARSDGNRRFIQRENSGLDGVKRDTHSNWIGGSIRRWKFDMDRHGRHPHPSWDRRDILTRNRCVDCVGRCPHSY